MANTVENLGFSSSDDSNLPKVKQQEINKKWQGHNVKQKHKHGKGNLDAVADDAMSQLPSTTATGKSVADKNITQKGPKELYAEKKQKAQQAALHIKATEGSYPNGYERLTEIKATLKNMSDKELKKIYEPHLKSLGQLQQIAQQKIKAEDVWAEGRDSINRGFLMSEEYTPFLKNPDILLAIFALEAYGEKNQKNPAKSELFVCMSSKQPLTISGMMEYGLKDNSLLSLECMPLNAKKSNVDHLQEYLNRKDIGKAIVPLLNAFDEAHKKLGLTSNSTIAQTNPYNIDKWKTEYKELFQGIEKIIADYEKKGKIKELLANFGKWQESSLIKQAQNGLIELCKKNGIKYEMEDLEDINEYKIQISLADLAKRIACTVEILEPSISHNLDRLHLLASLLDKMGPSQHRIILNDGNKISLKEVFEAVFKEFENPSEGNAIPAEQFYVRLKMIAEKEPFKSEIAKLPATAPTTDTSTTYFKPIPPPKPQHFPPSAVKIEQVAAAAQPSPTSPAGEIFGEVNGNYRVVRSPSGNFQIVWSFDSKEAMQTAVSALRAKGLPIKEGWQQKGFELTLTSNETFQLLGNNLTQNNNAVFNKIMADLEKTVTQQS